MFYIKAKVSIRIFGISGVSQEGISALVKATTEKEALERFQVYCRRKFAHMEFEDMTFEWLEIAPTI